MVCILDTLSIYAIKSGPKLLVISNFVHPRSALKGYVKRTYTPSIYLKETLEQKTISNKSSISKILKN